MLGAKKGNPLCQLFDGWNRTSWCRYGVWRGRQKLFVVDGSGMIVIGTKGELKLKMAVIKAIWNDDRLDGFF